MATYSCYVRGCRDDSVLGARHKLFGCVDACAGHDPITHGMALPLGDAAGALVEPEQPAPETPSDPNALIVEVLRNAMQLLLGAQDAPPEGGTKARLRRPVPIIPPSGTTARAF